MGEQSFFRKYMVPFLVGSISGCCATSVIQPIDCIKVLIQLKKQQAGKNVAELSPFKVAKQVIKNQGFFALYKGLDAALMRQVIYCGGRLGIYKIAQQKIKNQQKRDLTFTQKTVWSLLSGLIASVIANPTDLSLVRFQTDNQLPPEKKRNYKNVFDALRRIVKEEGVLTLWRGSTPTVVRAMALNFAMLVSYNSCKQFLQKLIGQQYTTVIRFGSSAFSGIAIAIFALPPDNIKTKLMSMKSEGGKLPYSGFLNCIKVSVQRQGVRALWIGITTFYFRVAPHAMITLIVQDICYDLFKERKNQKKE